MERRTNDIDWFFVKVRLEATYTLVVPAQDKEEALRSAYSRSIPVGSLYDVEKSVVKVTRMKQTQDTVEIEVLE